MQGCARSVYYLGTARLKLLIKENRINIALKALSAGSRLNRHILRCSIILDGAGESVSKKANKAEIMFPYATSRVHGL
jgi:hypothetical protein